MCSLVALQGKIGGGWFFCAQFVCAPSIFRLCAGYYIKFLRKGKDYEAY